MKAGKRTSEEIKLFLDASYQNKPPENIGDWILDKTISNKTGKVYYNPKTHEAVVAHRGTKGARDWINNVAYVTGTYKDTTRYKRGKNLQNKAEAKYGKENISTLGHSQGAILARDLGEDTKEIINVNPAYLGEKNAVNEYNIKSSSDIVSGFYPKKYKDIVIPSKDPFNILGEHSYNILDRLDDNQLIGKGLDNLKSPHYNIMTFGGRRCQELGYSVDDIDWINGGVRGGPRDVAKKMRRGMKPVSKTLSKANPLGYKEVQNVGAKMGDVTNNYLLPAVVSAGKPMLDVAAMGASTALTGNPFLGKTLSDIAWREGVEKTGNDPRERQKSKELGELSEVAGKTGSKFIGFGRKIGGILTDPTDHAPHTSHTRSTNLSHNTQQPQSLTLRQRTSRSTTATRHHLPRTRRLIAELHQPTSGTSATSSVAPSTIDGIINRYYNNILALIRRRDEGSNTALVAFELMRNLLSGLENDVENVGGRDEELRQIIAQLQPVIYNVESAAQREANEEGSQGCVASGRKKGGSKKSKPSAEDDFDEELSEIFGRITVEDERERPKGPIPQAPKATGKRKEAEAEAEAENAMEIDEPDEPRKKVRVKRGRGRTKKGGVRTRAEKKEARRMGKEDRPPLAHVTPLVEGYLELEAVDARPFEAQANFFADEMDAIEERYLDEQIPLRDALRYSRALSGRLSRQRNNLIPEEYDDLMRDSRRQISMFEMILSRQPAEEEGSVSCVASGRRSKKGGASLQQIGQAAAMRSFTQKNNPAYSLLSQIVHSADNPKTNPKLSPFQDLALTVNPDVQRILDAMTPSYLRSLHFSIDKGIKDGSLDPAYYLDILDRIEKRDPNAVRNVKNYNDKWGRQDEEVRRMLMSI